MRIAIVVLAAVLVWLLLRKKSQAGSLPSASGDAGELAGGVIAGLPMQPVEPGADDQVATYSAPGADPLEQMTNAIGSMEGYFKPGSLAYRTNNPGDIGTYGGTVASFPTPDAGWSRLNGYVSGLAQKHPGWDFYDFFHFMLTGDPGGAPGPNQDPDAYAEYVASSVGVDPTSTVSGFLGGANAYGS